MVMSSKPESLCSSFLSLCFVVFGVCCFLVPCVRLQKPSGLVPKVAIVLPSSLQTFLVVMTSMFLLFSSCQSLKEADLARCLTTEKLHVHPRPLKVACFMSVFN